MLHGPQRGAFNLTFEVPSICAEQVRHGQADIGIVPVATLLEQELSIFRGTGIASHGPVRTILLISKKPPAHIEVLAVDSGSRTSVMLSRVVLRETYGAEPGLISMPPQLRPMLEAADAALIIGDAALLLNPAELRARGLYVTDLGADWTRLSGLPMVFAVWAGRKQVHTPANEVAFIGSYRFGSEHIEEIVANEHGPRGVTPQLAREYLTRNIVFELGDLEYKGMETFLKAAAALPPAEYVHPATIASERINL